MLSTYRTGSGDRAAVLLHGFLGSGRNLRTLSRRLAGREPGLGVVVPDLAGHGASPALPPGADLSTLAREVLATIQALALPRPVAVVGHSLGGRVALQALALDDAALSRVVLLDIGPGPIGGATRSKGRTGDTSRALAALLAAPEVAATRDEVRRGLSASGLPRGIVEWLLANLVRADGGYRWRFDRAALAALGVRANAADLWPVVERHGARISCIRGGASPFVSAGDAERLSSLGCAVATLPGAGHLVHVDALDALVAALPPLR